MSQFEFILIAVTIVAGFAISEVLAGVGRSLRASDGSRYSGLFYLAALILLFLACRYIWTLWDYRSLQWAFSKFVLVLVPIFALALAAHVITVSASGDPVDLEEHYFSRARWFYILLIIFSISWALSDLANLSTLRSVTSENFLLVRFASVPVGVAIWAWLAHTRRRSHHWVILTGNLAYLVYVSFRVLPVLPE